MLGLETIKRDFLRHIDLLCVVNHRETSDNPDLVPGLSEELGVKCYEGRTEKPEFLKYIQREKPDFAVIMRHPHKIQPEFFESFREGVFNTHPSALPKHRGIAPLEYSVIEGGPLVATAFKISAGFDTGPILCRTQGTDIRNKYLEDVFPLAVNETNEVLGLAFEHLLLEGYVLEEQDDSQATFARRKNLPQVLSFDIANERIGQIYRKILARGREGTKLLFDSGAKEIRIKNVDSRIIGDIGEVIDEQFLQGVNGCLVFENKIKAKKLIELEVPYEFKQQY
ncbi:hypothetical protein HOC80_02920 [archaeon]|jgi:methionyl-tRNA formyltransferase|nr:hypothetical protein [archaeon]MBT4417031.1 hypothetical protein [archaeon]